MMSFTRPAHRAEFSDLEWAAAQPGDKAAFHLGDAVEFFEGGFGVIVKLNEPKNGRPASYACDAIEGYPRHWKHAWWYEGDFRRLVGPSPLRELKRDAAASENG